MRMRHNKFFNVHPTSGKRSVGVVAPIQSMMAGANPSNGSLPDFGTVICHVKSPRHGDQFAGAHQGFSNHTTGFFRGHNPIRQAHVT